MTVDKCCAAIDPQLFNSKSWKRWKTKLFLFQFFAKSNYAKQSLHFWPREEFILSLDSTPKSEVAEGLLQKREDCQGKLAFMKSSASVFYWLFEFNMCILWHNKGFRNISLQGVVVTLAYLHRIGPSLLIEMLPQLNSSTAVVNNNLPTPPEDKHLWKTCKRTKIDKLITGSAATKAFHPVLLQHLKCD